MGKILIIDDDPAIRFTLQEVLSDRGHFTVAAASGAEAMTKLDGVDAVVTDLELPAMDGLELLGAIRERDRWLPVLLVTARGTERAAASAIEAGACDFVRKPFDIDDVALRVERALESTAALRSRLLRASGS